MRRVLQRFTLATVAVATSALALVGCSPQPGGGETGAEDEIRIVFSCDKIDENMNRYIGFMEASVERLNDEGHNIVFESYDAQGSADTQISNVQTALIKEPDVLILSPVDAVGSLPAAQLAKDAGVFVINFRPQPDDPDVYDVSFGASQAAYADQTLVWMDSLLAADPDLTLNVGLIYGAAAQADALIREDAIKQYASENSDRVKIVAEQYGNWQTDIAQNTAADWVEAYPEINVISSANDAMALGVHNALVAAGVRDRVLVAAYDVNEASLDNIKNGTFDFTSGILAPGYGQVIDVAVGLVEGTFTDDVYNIEPVYGVTSDNVDEVLAMLSGE